MGIREGLFAELFKLLGIATFRTIPLSLLVYLGGVIWSLFGGLLYLFYRTNKKNNKKLLATSHPTSAIFPPIESNTLSRLRDGAAR